MTEEDKKEMLQTIGVEKTDDLFQDIPENVRTGEELKLPEPLAEPHLLKRFRQLSGKNADTATYPCFLGAGVYDHYIPSVVDHVIRRSEFYTAYTPYQPEISQGELQAVFEFQTMVASLTGMDIANSSMYDGHTALAEAALMAVSHSRMKRQKIIVSESIHPESLAVVETYASGPDLDVVRIPLKNGVTDMEALEREMDSGTAAVAVQYPNFFGTVEKLKDIEKAVHRENALFIVSSNPLALGILTPPGDFGADVVTGDMQPLGIPMQYGGPHCGFFAVKRPLMRKMPGRLVGETVDKEGKRGFVLTLQTREQHIRRDKATSNICSNQALNALASSVAMAALGKNGIREMALQNIQKAGAMKEKLKEAGIPLVDEGPVFNEFVIDLGRDVSFVNQQLFEKGVIGGLDLAEVDDNRTGQMLVCVTEMRTKDEMTGFVEALEGWKA
ncbi:aminomethyl-transferring glycine dehydrogenase subunit GcvPA [Salibacterium sp. K-3]